ANDDDSSDDDDATANDDDSGDDDDATANDDDSGDDDDATANDDDSGDDDDDDDDGAPGLATCSGADSLNNGDFELGTNYGWSEFSSLGATVVTGFASVTPYSGSWLAELGEYSSEQSAVWQDVAIPSWITYADMFYRYRIETNESSIIAYDTGGLFIIDPISGSTLSNPDAWNNGDQTNGFWLPRIIDLSAYSGQTVRIQWQWDNDSSATTQLLIDLVNLTCS
ncbi:MAG: hypothetical protein KDA24_18545, partial [Deltaproteobacteria bacterium]|nr:hypothetical protein [Deltaproteobacteria bacterium]